MQKRVKQGWKTRNSDLMLTPAPDGSSSRKAGQVRVRNVDPVLATLLTAQWKDKCVSWPGEILRGKGRENWSVSVWVLSAAGKKQVWRRFASGRRKLMIIKNLLISGYSCTYKTHWMKAISQTWLSFAEFRVKSTDSKLNEITLIKYCRRNLIRQITLTLLNKILMVQLPSLYQMSF